MIRAFSFLLSGNACAAGILLLRTVLISHLINLENFGIGASLVLSLTLIEMLTALGFQQQIVNAPHGDDPNYHSALHGVAMMRGVFGAGVLLVFAPPMADAFGLSHLVWAFQLMAVVPLMQGGVHLDVYRQTRQHKHRAAVWIALAPPLGSLIAVMPLSVLFDDFRIMLGALLVHMALGTLVHHAVAKRPYRMRLNLAITLHSLHFGWPLMASGAVMFLVFNGERTIVGRFLGLEPLALFSMAVSLTLVPSLVLMRSTMSFFLPRLTACGEPNAFAACAVNTLRGHIVLAGVMVAMVSLLGAPFVQYVLDDIYRAALPLLTLMSVAQALRVVKGGCAIVALGKGFRKTELLTDLLRIAFLPLAAWSVIQGASLVRVVQIAALGEGAGMVIALLWMNRVQHVPLRPLGPPMIWLAGTLIWAVLTHDDPLGYRIAGFMMLCAWMAMTLIGVRKILTRKGTDDGMEPPAVPGCLGDNNGLHVRLWSKNS